MTLSRPQQRRRKRFEAAIMAKRRAKAREALEKRAKVSCSSNQ